MVEVTLDKLPPGVGEATLQSWHFEEGDPVTQGDEIVELSTEEGPVTVTAPVSGILAEVYYDEGETVTRGEILCVIENERSFEDWQGDQDEEEEA